jgi:hypothetical protein
MTGTRYFNVPKEVNDALQSGPVPKSKAAKRALAAATARPELIPMALRVRPFKPRSNGTTRLGVTYDEATMSGVKHLSEQYDLSQEEIVRLMLEAYIYKL